MKKVLILMAVLAVALVGLRFAFGGSGARDAYESFADVIVTGRVSEALQHADGEQVAAGLTRKTRWTHTPPLMESMMGTAYEVESERKTDDGVELVVLQTVSYNPPGVESAMYASMVSRFRHHATVAKRGGEWKVVAFRSEHVETRETR